MPQNVVMSVDNLCSASISPFMKKIFFPFPNSIRRSCHQAFCPLNYCKVKKERKVTNFKRVLLKTHRGLGIRTGNPSTHGLSSVLTKNPYVSSKRKPTGCTRIYGVRFLLATRIFLIKSNDIITRINMFQFFIWLHLIN